MLEGNVFITGGAGYLARAIYRRAERENWPAKFTAYGGGGDSLHRLKDLYPHVRQVEGDVRNLDRLATAMAGHSTVIHAAAKKRVPEAEENVLETVEVNIQGSINAALAAKIAGADRCVAISTDKAVDPVNLYGTTKRVMESVFQEAATWRGPLYGVARYGNVIASTGSIVPVFRQQLKAMGEVHVTDPDMTRFWMTPDQAVDTILYTLEAMTARPGCVVSPLAAAMRIGDIARVIAGEARVVFTGVRPGEKMHEKLLSAHEASRTIIWNLARPVHVTLPSTQTLRALNTPATAYVAGYGSDAALNNWTVERMAEAIADAETI